MNHGQAHKLTGDVLELKFKWTEVVIELDAASQAYIRDNFHVNRDTATTVVLAPLWQRLLVFFSSGSTKVEFDLVHVGDRSHEMIIANVAGVDGVIPDWTSSEPLSFII